MNFGELLAAFRSDMDDEVLPYLWTDDEALGYLNDAQNEACRRARLIVDSDSPEAAQITFTGGVGTVALHPSVIYVRTVLDPNGRPVQKLRREYMDNTIPGWRTKTGDTIIAWIPDFSTGKIRTYPILTVETVLPLTVVRTALVPMAAKEDSPEIASRYHLALVNWMRRCAYRKPGPDTYNRQQAQDAEAEFDAEFGPAMPAVEEHWIHDRHGYDEGEGLL